MRNQHPKILIITDGYPTRKNLIYGLYVKQQTDELKKQVPDWGIDIYYNPFFSIFSNPLNKNSLFWNVIKWILQLICFTPLLFKKYDIIHAHRFFLPVFNAAAYKAFHPKASLIVTSHGIVQVRKRYKKEWTKKLFQFCDLIIAVNNEMRSEFIENFNLPKSKVVLRSCGVDFNYIDKITGKDNKIIKDKKNVCLGFVGIYVKNKKPDYFIKCIEKFKNIYDISGIMIGGGGDYGYYKDYIQKNDLPINIYGTLSHHDVIALYGQMDIFLFPSDKETFGIVGIEALYNEIPVVASSVGGKQDYIQEGYNGYLFENNNFDEMIVKVEKLLSDKTNYNKIKAQTRKSVLSYSRQNVVKEIVMYYNNIISNKNYGSK